MPACGEYYIIERSTLPVIDAEEVRYGSISMDIIKFTNNR